MRGIEAELYFSGFSVFGVSKAANKSHMGGRGLIYFSENKSVLFFMENKSVSNGTYLTCLACPFFLTSALADRRDLVSKG